MSRIANQLELDRGTVGRYLELLSDTMLLDLLPAVRPSKQRSLTAHPKLLVFDTGFASWATGLHPDELITSPQVWGGLIETLVAKEIQTQASWISPIAEIGHWRHGPHEVDLVIQPPGRPIIGVEGKSSAEMKAADTKGLHQLRSAVHPRAFMGIVVYNGSATYRLADDTWAVSLAQLLYPSPDNG